MYVCITQSQPHICPLLCKFDSKANFESEKKASINRDVSLCMSLGLLHWNTFSCKSVALQALCHCVKVDHLELRKVTAAAARLLANHHLEWIHCWSEAVKSCQTTDYVVKSHQTCHHGVQLYIILFQDITQIACHSLCCDKKKRLLTLVSWSQRRL